MSLPKDKTLNLTEKQLDSCALMYFVPFTKPVMYSYTVLLKQTAVTIVLNSLNLVALISLNLLRECYTDAQNDTMTIILILLRLFL